MVLARTSDNHYCFMSPRALGKTYVMSMLESLNSATHGTNRRFSLT